LAKLYPPELSTTHFSNDKPDRYLTVIKFWMDETSGVALDLNTGVPTYQVEDGLLTELAEVLPRRRREEGRTHLLSSPPN
jgi:hypothetical protein